MKTHKFYNIFASLYPPLFCKLQKYNFPLCKSNRISFIYIIFNLMVLNIPVLYSMLAEEHLRFPPASFMNVMNINGPNIPEYVV